MAEIHVFPVTQAEAEIRRGGIKLTMFYGGAAPREDRVKADPGYGVRVFKNLLDYGSSEVADIDHPLRSASGGAIYILEDGTVPAHRRDKFAPTHKWQLSIPGGFPQNLDQAMYPAEIIRTEGSELVLMTEDGELLLPEDDDIGAAIAVRAARRINLPIKAVKYVPFDYKEGPDELLLDTNGKFISSTMGYLDFFWESEAGLTLLRPCYVLYDRPEKVIAIDTEGKMKGEKYVHFQRETFMLKPEEIRGKNFGDHLDGVKVFKPELGEGQTQVRVQSEDQAKEPYFYRPDDMLNRMLFAPLWHGEPINQGSWLHHSLEFHEKAAADQEKK